MPSCLSKCRRVFFLWLANSLSGTHFFSAKRLLLRQAGISIGEGSRIVGPVHMGTIASLSIGKQTWVGHDLFVEGNGKVIIGNNVDIAPLVVFSTGGHEVGGKERRAGTGTISNQKVCDGSWVGIRSMLVNGVTVGESCVVAAGSVVVKDIESNMLAGAVPARVIRRLH